MRRVLVLAQNEVFGLKVMYCLHAAGFEVDLVSTKANSAARYSRYCSRFFSIPDKADIAEFINREAPNRKWEAVLGGAVASHGILNAIRDQISVPTFAPSPQSLLDECSDKWTFFQKLHQAGLPVPYTILINTLADLTPERVAEVGFPLMTKPLREESGNGIKRFDSFEALSGYLGSPGPYKSFPITLQHFVQGETLGLSFLAKDDEILCHDVQLDATNGSRVFYDDPEILEIGRKIVKAFGYGGPAHIDFVRDEKTGALYAIDFNCRFWFSVTVCMWRGGNFPERAVRIARGEPIADTTTRPGVYFPPGAVVGLLRRRPAALAKLDSANWRGFWQAVSDPIPHIVHKFH